MLRLGEEKTPEEKETKCVAANIVHVSELYDDTNSCRR
jgi:hypothetical protein